MTLDIPWLVASSLLSLTLSSHVLLHPDVYVSLNLSAYKDTIGVMPT